MQCLSKNKRTNKEIRNRTSKPICDLTHVDDGKNGRKGRRDRKVSPMAGQTNVDVAAINNNDSEANTADWKRREVQSFLEKQWNNS